MKEESAKVNTACSSVPLLPPLSEAYPISECGNAGADAAVVVPEEIEGDFDDDGDGDDAYVSGTASWIKADDICIPTD